MKKVRGKELKWQFKIHKDFGLKSEKQLAEEAFVEIPVMVLALLMFSFVFISIFIFAF